MSRLLIIFCLGLIPLSLMSQLSTTSPYSQFGIGEITNTNFSHLSHMGNLGASYSDPYHVNLTNPASLASLRATAFEVGVFTEFSTLSDDITSNTSFNGNMEYISLAFPTKNPYTELFENVKSDFSHSMAVSLLPHSSVGYNIQGNELVDTIGDVTLNYIGSGGTYKFMFSNGIKYKDFSAGINLSYLFGKIRFNRDISFDDLINSYSVDYENNYSIKGFLWNIGLMYDLVLNKKASQENTGVNPNLIKFGLTFGSNTSFNTESNIININRQEFGGLNLVDTVFVSEDLPGKGTLPGEFSLGATYIKTNKLAVGFNYSNTFWSNYENDAETQQELFNSSMLTFGGYYRPNYKSIDRYYKRIFYRFGLYYGNSPITVDNERVDDYGLTVGFGLPLIFQKKISHANLGFTFGKKGTDTPIQESFIRMSFGFTFNDDEWFIKRKYN